MGKETLASIILSLEKIILSLREVDSNLLMIQEIHEDLFSVSHENYSKKQKEEEVNSNTKHLCMMSILIKLGTLVCMRSKLLRKECL